MDLGAKDAKITVVEYASVGCPVCGKWQKEVCASLQGQVCRHRQGPLRVPRDAGRRRRGGHRGLGRLPGQARCAGKDKYFAVNDAVFASQPGVFYSPRETLLGIAKSAGMSEEGASTPAWPTRRRSRP
ncbi:DsbA family protein [Caulobacter segnis]